MKPVHRIVWSILRPTVVFFLAAGTCGCSYLGFRIGLEIDDGKQDRDTLHVQTAERLEPGDRVQVTLIDSTVVNGEFAELGHLDPADYSSRYEGFMHAHASDMNVPQPGDTIAWRISASRVPFISVFHGYGIGSLLVQMTTRTVRGFSQDTSSTIEYLPFGRLTSLERHDKSSFDLSRLQYMSNEGLLPLNMSIVVNTESDTLSIPFDEVVRVERINSRNARWIGGGIGLAVDAWFWLVVVNRGPLFDWGFGGLGSGSL